MKITRQRILAVLACLAFLVAGAAFAQSMSIDATATDGTNPYFAGAATSGPPAFFVGRLQPNGETDTTFYGGVISIAPQPGVASVQVRALTVSHFGDVFVASVQDGQLVFDQLTYGSVVRTTVDSGAGGLQVNAIYADPTWGTGAFYAIGSYTGPETGNVKTAAIVRYAQGARDLAFGVNGMRLYNLGTYNGGEFLAYVELYSWSSIVAVGPSFDFYPIARAAKLSGPAMDPDPSFGSGGQVTLSAGYPGATPRAISRDMGGSLQITGDNLGLIQIDPASGMNWGRFGLAPYWSPAFGNDIFTFSGRAAFVDPYGMHPTVAGTATDTTTGRSYFFGTSDFLRSTFVAPITANDDDVMTGAFPVDAQQFVALGTRQSASGDSALRVRYWYDGTFDTDFSRGPNNTVPNAFAFDPYPYPYGPGELALSSAIRVTGVNAGITTISVDGGQYYLANSAYECSATTPGDNPGTVANGQFVCVSVVAATTPATTSTVTLTVGGVQAQYQATTGTLPSTSITTRPPANSGSSVQFTYTGSSTSPWSFTCQLDGAAFAACPAEGVSYTDLTAGSHTFRVAASNAWGTDPNPASYTWSVIAPPTTTLTSTPPALSNSRSAAFSFVSSDPAATFECSLDGSAFATCTPPKPYTSLADGSHSFSVRSRNTAGVDPAPPAFMWTIDTVAPDTSITSGPTGTVSPTDATFAFTSTEAGSTFQCRVDGAAYAACVSPVTYSGLAGGAHTFGVYAVDAAGNADATPASRSWTIDVNPPRTSFLSGPSSGQIPNVIASASATFTFTSTKPDSTFQCSLDAAAFVACISGQVYSGLGDGDHTFTVRAVDGAGRIDPSPPTWAWTVDTIVAHATLTSQPPALSNQSQATFSFSKNDPRATVRCLLDGVVWSASCFSPLTIYNLAEGTHTFSAVASNVGGTDPSPSSYAWTIDTTAPVITITSQPPAVTASATASFSFTSSEQNTTFTCRLDAQAASPCSGSASYSGLADGSHDFAVFATDAAGNTSSRGITWSVDTTAPTVTINSGPNLATNQASAVFYFSSNDANATLQCSLDGAAFAVCTSPVSLSGLAAGAHVFQALGVDTLGNTGNPAAYSWTIDQTPPVATITSGPTLDTSATTATFTFTSNEPGSTFACESNVPGDAQGPYSCSTPKTYPGLVDGNYSFLVWAIDPAGNWSSVPAVYHWMVDTFAPDTLINSGPPATTSSTSATFAFGSTESGSTYGCALDGAAFSSCTSPVTYAGLADGSHTFAVRSTDGAGNIDPSPSSLTWTVDTSAPQATITSGPAAVASSTSAAFTYAASEPGASFDCALDGAAFASCAATGISYSGLSQGTHTFSVRARDAAGNVGPTASQAWTVDTVAPDTTITGGPTGNTTATSATFTFTSTESPATFQCSLDNAAFSSCTSPVTYSGYAKGTHTFQVRSKDTAGNVDATPASRSWTRR